MPYSAHPETVSEPRRQHLYTMDQRNLILWHHYRKKKMCLALFVFIMGLLDKQTPNRRVWIKHWVARRKALGLHHNLFLELQLEDPDKYRRQVIIDLYCTVGVDNRCGFRCLRMNSDMFEALLARVTPLIKKQNTHLRESISAAERLSVTLRHLATGETQESLSLTFRLGQSTISGIVKETSRAIYNVLKGDNLKFPANKDEWRAVALEYEDKWNFAHCIGALDGKHFKIDPPLRSGSLYYNYKEFFSIVLLALVDANMRFIYVDVGTNGRISDTGIWNKCSLKPYLENLNIPPTPLPGSQDLFPYVVVGDEIFQLTDQVLVPYSKDYLRHRLDRKIFNYRLSRARRCVENAFGILVARFQIFRSAMRYDPEDAKYIVLAACALHNWLRSDSVGRAMYTPPTSLDSEDIMAGTVNVGDWHNANAAGVGRFHFQGGNRHAAGPLMLRDMWCEYFNGVGAVPWQERMVTRVR
ncbi:Protein ALP1-like [Frankliniella fusca]|uniref:Protein ALP1-like n=1 Tax=Frankliniella fusca TaxID=407009 RepID=A0AAE1GTY8_9NEOP|nr:Protein ALP1-like [Frankliniella fusca]